MIEVPNHGNWPLHGNCSLQQFRSTGYDPIRVCAFHGGGTCTQRGAERGRTKMWKWRRRRKSTGTLLTLCRPKKGKTSATEADDDSSSEDELPTALQLREKRLNASSPRVLYHQTNTTNAASIRRQNMLVPGPVTGMAGSAVYFATNAYDTNRKATRKGWMVTAKVRLGKTKTIHVEGDTSITFESLLAEGYDSVHIPRPGGPEYVIYNSDHIQIESIQEYPHHW